MTILLDSNGDPVRILSEGRLLGVASAAADAPDALGYLLPPELVENSVRLQIDTTRSSPGVTTLRVLGPGRSYLLFGTAAVEVPLAYLTDDVDAPNLPLSAEAVTVSGLGPGTGVVLLDLNGQTEPGPTPAAVIVAPALLTVANPWDEGDGYTYVAPNILGTPTAGPTVVWQFRPATGGDWTDGAAWAGTVPAIEETTDVQLVTTITPGAGLTPVSAISPTYRAIPTPAAEIPPPALTAGQIIVVESLYRPDAQVVTFSPRVQFALTAHTFQFTAETDFSADAAWHTVTPDGDAFELFATGHPITPPAYDAALWTAIPGARLAQLRFRYKLTAGGLWSAASAPVTVPLPVEVEPTLGAVTNAMLTLAMPRAQHQTFNNGALGTNDTNTPHTYIIPAIAAWQGSTFQVGGQTPAAYMVAQFGRWDGFYPCAYGGIRGQRDLFFIASAALAKLTPAVWNALGAAQKQRIDVAMRGQLVSFIWQMSNTNPYVLNGGAERTIRGDQAWGRGFNPNFVLPGVLGPLMISQYMGGPAAANAFLTTYNHAAFVNEITALRNAAGGGGLQDLLLTFNALGPGVTAANLTAALQSPGGLPPTIGLNNQAAFSLAQVDELFAHGLTAKMWSKVVAPGLDASAPGGKIPKGYQRPAAGTFGILEPTNIAGAAGVGRNAVVGRLAAGAPAHPLLGQVGMAWELSSTDGGQNGSGGGPRSAMKYAYEGAVLCPATTVVLVAYNALSRADPSVIAAMEKQTVGMTDFEFRNLWGHRDFSKGGRPWAGTGNDGNVDWDQTDADAKLYSLLHDAFNLVVVPWAA